ncbi:MAG: hypothetical protein GY757_55580 [bacterium]|nr:hypothetical protein [bacterium]
MANCWEDKKCERQPGGSKVEEFGECPAATDTSADGLNNGKNGGRICWIIGGTLCGGEIQGSQAQKTENCTECDFYHKVKKEEGENFEPGI